MSAPYGKLLAHFAKARHLGHARSMLQWDAMVVAANQGGPARSAALAELDSISHALGTEEWLQGAVDEAAKALAAGELKPTGDEAPEVVAANVRLLQRDIASTRAVDPELVRRKSTASSEALRAWGACRAKNDWESFAPALGACVDAVRDEAKQVAPVVAAQRGVSTVEPYEALMDAFEPNATSANVEAMFGALKGWLPAAIAEAQARQAAAGDSDAAARDAVAALATAKFPLERQEAFLKGVVERLGFDLSAGRFDVIKGHPFCGGVPEDVRITTRLSETDFVTGLMGVVHETGHARYEQGRPRGLLDQPAGGHLGIGVHESQSLFFEMQLGRSEAFVTGYLAPALRDAFPEHAALLSESTLLALYRRVQPGKIRVDADELTYPLHVALRFELERGLINGDVPLAEIPGLWETRMRELLGVELPESERFANGCLQDMHWPHGAFGYFPTYTIGAATAAQLKAAADKAIPSDAAEAALKDGKFTPYADWLQQHVWARAAIPESTDALLTEATGQPLNAEFYAAHLKGRAGVL